MTWLQKAGDWAVWVVGVASALGVLWKWVAKPIKGIQRQLAVIQDDTGDLMGDRLSQAHDYWMRKRYCPKADKCRLLDMHKRYAEMGRNHLAAHYEQDLIDLPEDAPSVAKGA